MKQGPGETTGEPAPFLPLSKDGLVARVASRLTSAILSGKLAPGDRLAESTIARQMDLSRAPVREALRLLESSGLVDYRANRGFFVHTVSGPALDNLYELRIVIEGTAIARLVETNRDAALPRLRDQLDVLYRIADQGTDIVAQVDADMQFHRLICEGSGNPRFLQIFDQISNETKLGLLVIGQLYDDPRKLAETHEPIVQAVADGDAAAARAAIEYHIDYARQGVVAFFAKDRDDRSP